MKKILVIPNTLKDTDLSVTARVVDKLLAFDMMPMISSSFRSTIGDGAYYFDEYPSDAELVLVVGGEKRGVSREVMALCDQTVRIDYGREFRGSLSAASAATVLGFEVLHQNK